MVYILPFLSRLANFKSSSVRQPVLPGYEDNCRHRSYCFVDWQKLIQFKIVVLKNKMPILALVLVASIELGHWGYGQLAEVRCFTRLFIDSNHEPL